MRHYLFFPSSNRSSISALVHNIHPYPLSSNFPLFDSSWKDHTLPPYDVFINYCASDVKHTIYHWIEDEGLTVFFSTPDFQSDRELPAPIVEAIHGASVHITILSKEYAQNPCCLDELCSILKTNARVIPVFYDVRPSELRYIETGTYSSAFTEYERKSTFSGRTLSEWKVALNTVADYCGFDLNNFNGDEGELLMNIVDSVLKAIDVKPDVGIHGRLFGLDQAVADFDQCVVYMHWSQGPKATFAGILGEAGSGKTTLARELYHRKRSSFRRSSFLCDVGSDSGSLQRFHTQLLKDLAGIEGKFSNTSEAGEYFKRHMTSLDLFRVLLVLDGIEAEHHLDALFSIAGILGPDSLIIVTSRHRQIHDSLGIRRPLELKGLAPQHAEELFCYHAFQQPRPTGGYKKLVRKALSKCEGLPLFIKLLSGHLNLYGENSEDDWKDELAKIGEKSDILEVSYDALWEEEKQIFLDISCFVVGEDTSSAMRIWDESGWRGSRALKTLECKFLVDVNGENRLQMHDHVRDFGRAKASEQTPRRICSCNPASDVAELLKNDTKVRGIVAAPSQKSTLVNEQQLEEELSEIGQVSSVCLGLKLLLIKGNYFEDAHVLSKLSKDLVWLRCHDSLLQNILPSCSPMEHLRVLQVTGRYIRKLWQGKFPPQLRELHCEGILGEVPQWIGSLAHLDKLVLDCGDLICSHTLPEEIFSLKSLQHMEIHCKSLRSLPNRFGDLTSIRWINFSGCSELRMLPESFGCLTRLQYLGLENCNQMEVLPTQIRFQESLTKLDVAGTGLQELPANTFGIMSNLQFLRIGSPFLASLPSSIGSLFSLTHLELDGCTNLMHLPESLGQLNHLTHLSIVSSGIEILQRGVARLTNLEELTVANCPLRELTLHSGRDVDLVGQTPDSKKPRQFKILRYKFNRLRTLRVTNTNISNVSIPEDTCPNLESLDLSCNRHLIEVEALATNLAYLTFQGCNILKRISGDFYLPNLRALVISGCSGLGKLIVGYQLQSIKGLENLAKLQVLDIHGCSGLYSLSIPAPLSCLEMLNARHCCQIRSIEGLENLPKLRVLDIGWCSDLCELSIPGHLSRLEKLNARSCYQLRSIQGLENLANLRVLDINGCFRLYELSIPVHLSCLETLNASGCYGLHSTKVLGNLPKLQVLDISRCSVLSELSIRGQLRGLEILYASGCHQLRSIQGLENVVNLRVLEIDKCYGIHELSIPAHLTFLEILNASGCYGLLSIKGLENLPKLQVLDIKGCSKLSELSIPGHLNCLEKLNASCCYALRSIRGLENLPKLQMLNLNGCYEISELPILGPLSCLEALNASDCKKLQRIPGLENLANLRVLNISKCSAIDELSLPVRSSCLETLTARGCRELQRIQGLDKLARLRVLDISQCDKLHIDPQQLAHLSSTLVGNPMVLLKRDINKKLPGSSKEA